MRQHHVHHPIQTAEAHSAKGRATDLDRHAVPRKGLGLLHPDPREDGPSRVENECLWVDRPCPQMTSKADLVDVQRGVLATPPTLRPVYDELLVAVHADDPNTALDVSPQPTQSQDLVYVCRALQHDLTQFRGELPLKPIEQVIWQIQVQPLDLSQESTVVPGATVLQADHSVRIRQSDKGDLVHGRSVSAPSLGQNEIHSLVYAPTGGKSTRKRVHVIPGELPMPGLSPLDHAIVAQETDHTRQVVRPLCQMAVVRRRAHALCQAVCAPRKRGQAKSTAVQNGAVFGLAPAPLDRGGKGLPSRRQLELPVRKLLQVRQCHPQRAGPVRFQPRIVIRTRLDQRGQATPVKAAAVLCIAGAVERHFLFDPPKVPIQELGRVSLAKLVHSQEQCREQILLAVRVAQPRVSPDASKPPVTKDETTRHHPQVRQVMKERRRRFPPQGPHIKVKHGRIGKTDQHIADIQVPVMVQRIVGEKVGAHVPLPHRLSGHDAIVLCIRRDTHCVDQKLMCPLLPQRRVGKIGIHRCRAPENRPIPQVRLGHILARMVPRIADNAPMRATFIVTQEPFRLADQHTTQCSPVLVRQVRSQQVHAVHHPFDPERTDPGMPPLRAIGAAIAAGKMAVQTETQCRQRACARPPALLSRGLSQLLTQGAQHCHRAHVLLVRLDAPGIVACAIAAQSESVRHLVPVPLSMFRPVQKQVDDPRAPFCHPIFLAHQPETTLSTKRTWLQRSGMCMLTAP